MLYLWHPDGVVILRSDAGDQYLDTPDALALDAGIDVTALPGPGMGEDELSYVPGLARYFDRSGLVRSILTDLPVADDLLSRLPALLAAQATRTAPPPPPTPGELKALVMARLDTLTDDPGTEDLGVYVIALALVTMDEVNVLRGWDRALMAAVAASTSLADLKVRVAALPILSDRTAAQVRSAVKAQVQALLA